MKQYQLASVIHRWVPDRYYSAPWATETFLRRRGLFLSDLRSSEQRWIAEIDGQEVAIALQGLQAE